MLLWAWDLSDEVIKMLSFMLLCLNWGNGFKLRVGLD